MLTGLTFELEIYEYVICFWVLLLLIEELRQMSLIGTQFTHSSGSSCCARVRQKFIFHISEFWNILDFCSIALYFFGFGMRVAAFFTKYESVLIAAHICLSINIVIMYVRCLHFFAIHNKIGALLIMIGHMMEDLVYFVFILIAVLVGYGVSLHSLLFQIQKFDISVINNIFRIPFFQIYGDLYVEETLESEAESDSLFVSRTTETPGPRNYFALMMAGFYMLMANTLLFNLLIAKFNTSYTKIQDNVAFYHVTHKITILEEYKDKFNFPPPLSVISYVINLFKYCPKVSKERKTRRISIHDHDFFETNNGDEIFTQHNTKREQLSCKDLTLIKEVVNEMISQKSVKAEEPETKDVIQNSYRHMSEILSATIVELQCLREEHSDILNYIREKRKVKDKT